MARVFVTGATGNGGRAVVATLLDDGHEVVALVRREQEIAGVEIVLGTLEDADLLGDAISGCDGLIHLACSRSNSPADVITQDIVGTHYLLSSWSQGPFVFVSSQTVYGVPNGPLDESSPYNPACWYDLGKVTNELQIRLASSDKVMGVSLRMGLLFGADVKRAEGQFLSMVVRHVLARGSFFFESERALETAGSSFVGEADFGRGVCSALGATRAGEYNLLSGFCTWKELIEAVAVKTGRRARIVVAGARTAATDELRLPQSRSQLSSEALTRANGFRGRQRLADIVGALVW